MPLFRSWPHPTCALRALAPQILGNNECFEPYTSNIYVRRVLSGEFTVVNQHLLADLTRAGLWTRDLKNELVAANGSVQVLPPARTTACCASSSGAWACSAVHAGDGRLVSAARACASAQVAAQAHGSRAPA